MENDNKTLLDSLLNLNRGTNWLFRLKTIEQSKTTEWRTFIISPTDNYVEIDTGPIPFRLIDYIDIVIFEEVSYENWCLGKQ